MGVRPSGGRDVRPRAFRWPREPTDRTVPPGFLDTPGLTTFLAYRTDQPVSTVVTTRVGPVVGVWAMGTPPEHQRQGAGTAVLSQAIARHRERGASLFYLLATQAGQPLYRKVGFTLAAELPVWVRGHLGEGLTVDAVAVPRQPRAERPGDVASEEGTRRG